MGEQHPSMEEERGLLPRRGNFMNPCNQEHTRLVNNTKETVPAGGDQTHHNLELEDNIKGGHGFEDDRGPSLSINHGPGDELSNDNGASGDRDVEDEYSTAQGWDKGGSCPLTQETTEQAASKEVQPQMQKDAGSKTSRTQSYSSMSSPPEKYSDFSQNTDDSISLHLLRIEPSRFPLKTEDLHIIRTLQKRPSIDFKSKIPFNSGKLKLTEHRASKKRARDMESPSTPTKKRDQKASTSSDNAAPEKESQREEWDYDSSPERFQQTNTPPDKGRNNDEATTTAAPALTQESEQKKKKSKADEYQPTSRENANPGRARTNMSDRYNTLSKASKYIALHNAVVQCVKDPEEKKAISELSLDKWHKLMETGVNGDLNPAEMSKYHTSSAGRPGFDLDQEEECEIQKLIQYDHQLTDDNSTSEGHEGRKGYKGEERGKVADEETHQRGVGFPPFSADIPENVRRNTVVGNYKFEYVIYITNDSQNLASNDDIHDHATQFTESFTNREQANAKLLELTQYENFEGDVDAVTRRNIFEYTPLKLLKAEITLATGEERVFWVDRHLVELQNLTKRQQRSRKWSAKRPALPHFIVECEFMTRGTSETPEQPTDDESNVEEGVRMSDETVGNQNGDIELERLPLTTFTDRKLANDHAGALFLRHSAVSEEIRTPLDDFWWVNNAVSAHREAEKKARERDGRYSAEIYSMDMNTRLGFDWMRVAVYAVDDVTGPLNI
ncbi:hypothetical protein F4805DRAFT_463125 [Annulohypoxylon moriforme]|nr:hypothetical protein F4805DRAFT_463125 [Annulohypoxylon moriforme]